MSACAIGKTIERLDSPTAWALLVCLGNKRIGAYRLHRVLSFFGIRHDLRTIEHHRAGTCRCTP